MRDVNVLVVFASGALSVLSPYGVLLVPAFLAYALRAARGALARTGAFAAGVSALIVPLGVAGGALDSLVQDHRDAIVLATGGLLIALGVLQFLGGGLSLRSFAALLRRVRGDSAASASVLGLSYAFAAFCSAPALSATLNVAGRSGSALETVGVLAAFALGMVVPAAALAVLWDRFGAHNWARQWDRRLGPFEVRPLRAVSGLLVASVGVLLAATNGTERLLSGAGSDAARAASSAVSDTVGHVPANVELTLLALLAAATIGVAWRRHRAAASE